MSEARESFAEVSRPECEEDELLEAEQAVADPDARASTGLDMYIFAIMTGILVLLSVLLVTNLRVEQAHYQLGLNAAVGSSPPDHSAALTYAQASDAAVIKLSALFLGFLLVFTGTLYVLRTASAHFKIKGTALKAKWALQTSSPGLVVVTLGVVLVATSLLAKNGVTYSYEAPAPGAAAPTDSIAPGAATPISNAPTLQMVNP
jgi:energy-converting hydrogenase Eha subunit H